jgi:hypothetical protein
MKKPPSFARQWGLLAFAILSSFSAVFATPYWTPEDYQRSLALRDWARSVTPSYQTPALESYSYIHEYFQICQFLSRWQVSNPSNPNYGGEIEGESGPVANIVETDNTQESIRVWSRYAELSGDMELYRHNIEAAWQYVMNFPAYNEEGGDSDYYRVHNCGWALIAQVKYLDVYGDATYTQYADSCARYLQTHLLNFNNPNPFYQLLHPLVTGWAAGTLYLYGEYTGVQSYVDSALVMADRVIHWIEADPNRLNTTEVWAMSAGTAMWGICSSRFQEDPTYGQTWLSIYGGYLDPYQASGQWNNSWNVWYAHAYHYMHDITGSSLYHYRAVSIVDTLLAMDTDNDGGIMATSTDPDTIDQTWVSCYLNWMGIDKIIDSLAEHDAGVLAFLSPRDSLPYMVGNPIEITVVIGNQGTSSLGTVPVNISGAYTGSSTASLPLGGIDTITFSPTWIPQSAGELTLFAYTGLVGDQNPSNDTLSITVTVIGRGTLAGRVYDANTQEGIEANLLFYHNLYPPEQPIDSTVTDSISGDYSILLPVGEYRVVMVPEVPYSGREWDSIQVSLGDTTELDAALTPAPLVLVDDDQGANLESYYTEPLQALGIDTYIWDVAQRGSPDDALQEFPHAIWFTGNSSGQAITSGDIQHLEEFLDGAGNLLLTGQDLETSLEGTAFAAEYLHTQIGAHEVTGRMLNGVAGDPISNGISLFILGGGGAQNQYTPGEVLATSGGVEFLYYNMVPPRPGAVRFDNGSYKSMVMTFGLEGVSGSAGTNSRQEILQRILGWFDPEFQVPEPGDPAPVTFSLGQNYPNPFNATTVIPFQNEMQSKVTLVIYNLLGQRVKELLRGNEMAPGMHRLVWDGRNEAGVSVASGIYLYRIQMDKFVNARKLLVLR